MSEAKRKPKRRFLKSGRSVMLVVAGLLACSGVIRLVEGSGTAFAREATAEEISDASTPAEPSAASPAQLEALLEELREREARLLEREREAASRLAAAELAEERVAIALRELDEAELELRATMEVADQAAENDLLQLTAVYENMKPQQAAPLFAQMSPNFAAGFLGRMRPDAAAAIMAGLPPETAYAVSVILAGRNANVPRPGRE